VAETQPGVRVRYYAGARAAAGISEESASAATLAELRTELLARHPPRFATVLAACAFLIDGQAATNDATELIAGATVEVLPPFAGG
jgi:molybdopterin synthase sulfur carrier subunit